MKRERHVTFVCFYLAHPSRQVQLNLRLTSRRCLSRA